MGKDWGCRDFSHQALGPVLTEPLQPDQAKDVAFNFSSSSGSCYHTVFWYTVIPRFAQSWVCRVLYQGKTGYFRSAIETPSILIFFLNEMLF